MSSNTAFDIEFADDFGEQRSDARVIACTHRTVYDMVLLCEPQIMCYMLRTMHIECHLDIMYCFMFGFELDGDSCNRTSRIRIRPY